MSMRKQWNVRRRMTEKVLVMVVRTVDTRIDLPSDVREQLRRSVQVEGKGSVLEQTDSKREKSDEAFQSDESFPTLDEIPIWHSPPPSSPQSSPVLPAPSTSLAMLPSASQPPFSLLSIHEEPSGGMLMLMMMMMMRRHSIHLLDLLLMMSNWDHLCLSYWASAGFL